MAPASSNRGNSSINSKHQAGAASLSAADIPRIILQAPAPSTHPFLIPPGDSAYETNAIFMDHCKFAASPVHGFGIFAVKDIEPGTLIMKEKALWAVDTRTALRSTFSPSHDFREARSNMNDAYCKGQPESVNEEEKSRCRMDILTLCGGFTAEEQLSGNAAVCQQIMTERLREILILNGVAESVAEKPQYAVVFRASSRLNHSCAPNAERIRSKRLNDGSVWCMVYTTAPIKKGEEIFINYVDPLATFLDRQDLFYTRWKFVCTCHLCRRPKEQTDASDERRELLDCAITVIANCAKKHTEPKPDWQKHDAHRNHLEQCDRITVGEAGLEMVEKYAKEEGVNDIKLFNTLMNAADAAARLKKLSLETRLVDRMLAVCRSYSISDEMDRNIAERREYLRKTAETLAAVATSQLLKLGKAV